MRSFLSQFWLMWYIADIKLQDSLQKGWESGHRNGRVCKEISLERAWPCVMPQPIPPKMRARFIWVTSSLLRGHLLASTRALHCSVKLKNTKEYCLHFMRERQSGLQVMVHCSETALPDCQSKRLVPAPCDPEPGRREGQPGAVLRGVSRRVKNF